VNGPVKRGYLLVKTGVVRNIIQIEACSQRIVRCLSQTVACLACCKGMEWPGACVLAVPGLLWSDHDCVVRVFNSRCCLVVTKHLRGLFFCAKWCNRENFTCELYFFETPGTSCDQQGRGVVCACSDNIGHYLFILSGLTVAQRKIFVLGPYHPLFI